MAAIEERSESVQPVARGERIQALDVLRGFALLGILLVNVQSFGATFYDFSGGVFGDRTIDLVSSYLVRTLCELKFITIFSFLFGVGFAIQTTRAHDRKDKGFTARMLRRLFILGIVGFVHGVGFWYGDILFVYAYCGLPLLLLLKLSQRDLLLAAVGFLALSFVTMAAISALASLAPESDAEELVDLEAFHAAPFEYLFEEQPGESAWDQLELSAYREGPAASAFALRVSIWTIMAIVILFLFSWRIVAVFLLGGYLYRAGWFDPRNISRWRKVIPIGLGVGLALEGGAFLCALGADDVPALAWADELLHDFASIPLAAGYIGIVTILSHRKSMIMSWLASAGRWALTCYLGQTLLATMIFYWWGFGQFGRFSHSQLVLTAFLIFALEVVLCRIGSRFLVTGPCEWAWRSLTYLKPQRLWRVAERGPMG